MKPLTLLFSLLFSLPLFSQTWIGQGAEWHYYYTAIDGEGFIKINYTKDTVIQNQSCQMLEVEKHSFTGDEFGNTVYLGSSKLPNQYTYASGDTVFYFTDGFFSVLYNFRTEPNNSWNLGQTSSDCGESFAKVDSLSTELINGYNYRCSFLNYNTDASVYLKGKVVERFGAVDNYLFPMPNNCDSTIIVDFDNRSLICYSDNSFELYKAQDLNCELSLAIYEQAKSFKPIVKNPSAGYIEINNTSVTSIKVYSVTGKLIKTSRSNIIDISENPDGLYFLKVENDKQQTTLKVVKQPVAY